MDKKHDAEIKARLNVVVARAHRPLTGDEIALVRRRIERDLKQREEMRALSLANGDAPDSGFNPRVTIGGVLTW